MDEMPVPHERPVSYLKNSFIWAFFYLKNGYTYYDALSDIIKRGGDTSINGAVVGGLIGALHGKNNIPEFMRNAITGFHPDQIDLLSKKWEGMLYPGPDFEQKITNLYNGAPSKLAVIWSS